MACYSDLVELAEVAAYVAALGPVTGIQQARDALWRRDENSWSPQETQDARRVDQASRPAAPVVQRPGLHRSTVGTSGTPDLISPELGLLGLYNGSATCPCRRAADLKKEAAYRDLGLEPVTMLATDWHDLGRFTSACWRLRAGSGPRRPGRRWVLDRRRRPRGGRPRTPSTCGAR